MRVFFHIANIGFFHIRKRFVCAAKIRILHRAIKVMPIAQKQRAFVTMELNPPLLALKAHIEVGRQACHRSIGKFDRRDGEIGRRNVERNSFLRDPIRVENLPKGGHTTCRTEDRRQNGQRIDRDIEERTDLVKRVRCRVPGLDAPPVDLRVGHTHCAKQIIANSFPCGLLPFTQHRDRSTPKIAAFFLCQCDQLPGFF